MARNNNRSSDDNRVSGKIRFIMVEADIDGNLSEITQAIANAVRPAGIIQQILPATPQVTALPTANTQDAQVVVSNGHGAPQTPGLFDDEDDAEVSQAPPTKAKKTAGDKANKPEFKGKPDDNLKWDGNGTSFAAYMKQMNPEETSKKYLHILAWFKLHGEHESIDGNMVWNAYRMLGWTPLGDITQPFRGMMQTGYVTQPNRGQYAITKIGLGTLTKMNAEKSVGES